MPLTQTANLPLCRYPMAYQRMRGQPWHSAAASPYEQDAARSLVALGSAMSRLLFPQLRLHRRWECLIRLSEILPGPSHHPPCLYKQSVAGSETCPIVGYSNSVTSANGSLFCLRHNDAPYPRHHVPWVVLCVIFDLLYWLIVCQLGVSVLIVIIPL